MWAPTPSRSGQGSPALGMMREFELLSLKPQWLTPNALPRPLHIV